MAMMIRLAAASLAFLSLAQSFSLRTQIPHRISESSFLLYPSKKTNGARVAFNSKQRRFSPLIRRAAIDGAAISNNDASDDDEGVVDAVSRPVEAIMQPFRFRNRLVRRLFEAADLDNDGYVSPEEAYALVLRMYVQLNRQAPIPAPSAATVRALFDEADANKDGRVSKAEFHQLAHTLMRRAMSRLVAHKCVTLIGAPLLAAQLVNVLKGQPWLKRFVTTVVPQRYIPVVTNPTFVRTFLLVGLVASLGNIVLGVVNWVLNRDLGK